MTDWADAKAQKWFNDPGGEAMLDDGALVGLAALLREVDNESALRASPNVKRSTLAEVRRVVEECGTFNADWENCSNEILSRLEKL